MMRAAFATVALPFYAVAIGVQCVVLAYRLARREARMQAAAKAATEQFKADLAYERARAAERVTAASPRWRSN